MQSSSNELSISAAVKRIYEQRKNDTYKKNSFAYAEFVDDSAVRYPIGVSQPVFDVSLKHISCPATLMSFDTTNQYVRGWQYIYIYIYIYIKTGFGIKYPTRVNMP